MSALPPLERAADDGERARAESLLAAGELDRAREILDRVLGRDPSDSHAQFLAGLVRLRSQQAPAAEPFFRQALTVGPSNHNAAYYLGLSLEAQGREHEAREAFGHALILNPNFAQARAKVGSAPAGGARPAVGGTAPGRVATPPQRTWDWYDTRSSGTRPPLLFRLGYWGCLAVVIAAFLAVGIFLIGLFVFGGQLP